MASDARPPDWQRRGLLLVLALVLALIAWIIATAFLPRWWSDTVGGLVGESFGWGVWWGLVFGFLCTALPVLVLRQAPRALTWRSRGWLAASAVALAVPNLLTLGIVAGSSDTARRAHHTLGVRGPGFTTSSLLGALAAVAAVIAIELFFVRYRSQRRELRRLRVEDKLRRANGPQ